MNNQHTASTSNYMTKVEKGPPAVELVGVAKTYLTRTGEVAALEGIDLKVEPGEFVAMVGPSGCGKSTILKMVAGLVAPTKGSIRIFGEIASGPPRSLGMAFQHDLLLPWRNVIDNVLLQADLGEFEGGVDRASLREKARDLLLSVGLEGFEHKNPRELSGGMRQRVALCRALIGEPSLLLLDEPFASLDAITRDQMGLDLQHLWMRQAPTVIFVTHSIAESVFLADRVVVLETGPGRVADIFPIDWPRPRTIDGRDSPASLTHVRMIRATFEAMGVYADRERSRGR
jgi:NitT/TauT family transport system ATP-binding protein